MKTHNQRMVQHEHNMHRGRAVFMRRLTYSMLKSRTVTNETKDILVRIEHDVEALYKSLNQRVNANGEIVTVHWKADAESEALNAPAR